MRGEATVTAEAERFDRQPIREALNQLHPVHRELICKAYYLRLTTAQIADDLKITETVVKSRLHYALHALRLNLKSTVPATS